VHLPNLKPHGTGNCASNVSCELAVHITFRSRIRIIQNSDDPKRRSIMTMTPAMPPAPPADLTHVIVSAPARRQAALWSSHRPCHLWPCGPPLSRSLGLATHSARLWLSAFSVTTAMVPRAHPFTIYFKNAFVAYGQHERCQGRQHERLRCGPSFDCGKGRARTLP